MWLLGQRLAPSLALPVLACTLPMTASSPGFSLTFPPWGGERGTLIFLLFLGPEVAQTLPTHHSLTDFKQIPDAVGLSFPLCKVGAVPSSQQRS